MDTTSQQQACIADDIEAAAYRDMYAAAPRELVQALNLQSLQIAGATLLMATGISDPVFARTIGLGNNGSITDTDIDSVIIAYRDTGIGSYWIHVNPIVAPRDLTTRLEQRGFRMAKRRTWAKMIRGTESAPQFDTAFGIRIANANEFASVSAAVTTAFGMTPLFAQWIQNMATRANWTLVTALDGDRVVGGGLLYIENQLAWLGLGGVIPEARGRNVHRAIMALRIAIAIERGCMHIVTETGEPINNEPNPSLRNMYRCGFTRVCSRLNYAVTKPVMSDE